MSVKITEILQNQNTPPDFNEFFQNQAIKQREVVDLLDGTVPTSGSLDELNENKARNAIISFLKRNQPFLSSVLIHDKERIDASEFVEQLEDALEGNLLDEIILKTLQAMVYSGISFEEFINYHPKRRNKKG